MGPGLALWGTVVALAGAGRGGGSQRQLPGRGPAAVTGSRHPLQPHPALGAVAPVVVALPPAAVTPVCAVAQPAAGHRRAPAVPRNRAAGAVSAGTAPGGTNRWPAEPRCPTGVADLFRPGDRSIGWPRGQHLAAPDPRWRPNAEAAKVAASTTTGSWAAQAARAAKARDPARLNVEANLSRLITTRPPRIRCICDRAREHHRCPAIN